MSQEEPDRSSLNEVALLMACLLSHAEGGGMSKKRSAAIYDEMMERISNLSEKDHEALILKVVRWSGRAVSSVRP